MVKKTVRELTLEQKIHLIEFYAMRGEDSWDDSRGYLKELLTNIYVIAHTMDKGGRSDIGCKGVHPDWEEKIYRDYMKLKKQGQVNK